MTIRLPLGTGRRRPCAAGEARRPRCAWPSAMRSRSRRAIAGLIDRADPDDPIARQFVPDIAELTSHAGRARRPDRRQRAFAGRRHRAPLSGSRAAEAGERLRGLLPLLLPPRDGRAGQEGAHRATARCRARLHRDASRNLGGDPHRRRSAGALRAPPWRSYQAHRRDRSREDHPPAHAFAGGLAREGHARARARAESARRDHLRGAACQPSARADTAPCARRSRASSMPASRW